MAYIGSTPTSGDFVLLDNLTASATASYTMQRNSVNFEPQSANHMIVSLNGTIQKPGSSFTISGSTITFASALTSSDAIDFILVLGNVNDVGVATSVVDSAITKGKLDLISTSGSPGLTVKGDGSSENGTIQLNCSQNSHGVKISSPAHSSGQSYELILPTGNVTADKFLKVASVSGSGATGIGQLSFADAGGGAYTLLSNNDLSSGVSEFKDADFFTTYSSYKHFLLDCQFIVPDDGYNDMIFVFQDGSGDVAGNIRSTAKSNRGNNSDEDGVYGRNGTAASDGINIFEGSRGTNNQGMNLLIELWQPISSDGDINMMWRATGIQSGYYAFATGGGMSESGTNATGFVIKRTSGNLTQNISGASYIKIYGLAAS